MCLTAESSVRGLFTWGLHLRSSLELGWLLLLIKQVAVWWLDNDVTKPLVCQPVGQARLVLRVAPGDSGEWTQKCKTSWRISLEPICHHFHHILLPRKSWSQTRIKAWIDSASGWRKEMATQSGILGKSHGQRSLVDHHPWGRKRVGRNLAAKQ